MKQTEQDIQPLISNIITALTPVLEAMEQRIIQQAVIKVDQSA